MRLAAIATLLTALAVCVTAQQPATPAPSVVEGFEVASIKQNRLDGKPPNRVKWSEKWIGGVQGGGYASADRRLVEMRVSQPSRQRPGPSDARSADKALHERRR